MYRTEVSTTGAYDESLHYTSTPAFQAILSSASVGLMMLLELTTLSIDVLIITHRVSAKVDAFLQDLLHRFKGEGEVLIRYHLGHRAWVNTRTPKYFVRINIANTSDESLVHQNSFDRSNRSSEKLKAKKLPSESVF